MKSVAWRLAGAMLLGVTVLAGCAKTPQRQVLLDRNWTFALGDTHDAGQASFDDNAWRKIDLPHDWSIEGTIAIDNPTGGGGGFFPDGIAWYRRTFTPAADWQGKKTTVEFESVYMNADIYLNGQRLASHPYGYTTFTCDLTGQLQFNRPNVLAVRVDNSKQPNSRWYSGAGIYRHVWLRVTDPVHIAHWGTSVVTDEIKDNAAQLTLRTRIVNESDQPADVVIETQLLHENSPAVEISMTARIDPHKDEIIAPSISISNPRLWSPQSPALYTAVTRIKRGSAILDETTTPFGIRTLQWSADKGLLLNGQSIKLLGGCVHHDNGCLGAAAFDRAEARRVELLKDAGFNAIRTSHNPPSPAFLDACDRLGMLVIDEAFDCWQRGKNPHDYHVAFNDNWQKDIDALVLRDRNHPSVIMWSIGNEIPEKSEPAGAQLAKKLADYVRSLDSSRPVTAAVDPTHGGHPWTDTDPYFATLDIGGYNYTLHNHKDDHQRFPNRIMVATESFPRAAFDYWSLTEDNPYILGDFVWTALDYLGEAGIGQSYTSNQPRKGHGRKDQFPWHGAYCGDLDLTGFRKPISHYRNILWNRGETIYAAVHRPEFLIKPYNPRNFDWAAEPMLESWTWPGQEGKELQVEIFSRCDSVQLLLNGKLIGEKPTTRAEQFKAAFAVPYTPGELKAIGLCKGQKTAEYTLRTAGSAVALRLKPDRSILSADGQDLAYVTVEAVDAAGQLVPTANDPLRFNLTGPGIIAGVDNGDLSNLEPYQARTRRLVNGRALLVIRTTRTSGPIHLLAETKGLLTGVTQIQSTPPTGKLHCLD